MLAATRDRYRPLFCESAFYQKHQPVFRDWTSLFQNLTDPEKVQAWVAALTLLRRPDDWFGGVRKTKLNETVIGPKISLKALGSIRVPPRLASSMTIGELMTSVFIKPLPETCLRALTRMTTDYPLEIVRFVPSPQQLLSYQLSGKRIISFNEEFATWPHTIYHGRDFLSFMIHDLIHADHFFSSPKHRAGQLGFYRAIEKIGQDAHLTALLKNEGFREAFEYIISDMNSHPVHLFKTLHAVLRNAAQSDAVTSQVWQGWTEVWSRKELTSFLLCKKLTRSSSLIKTP